MPKVGKHQLENNFFTNSGLSEKGGCFQKYTDEVKDFENIHISTLAMDFPEKTTKKERIEIESEWIEKLPTLDNIKHLTLRHRVNNEYFDSICRMKNLEGLYFWTSTVDDIKLLSKLKKLKYLHLELFSRLTDISPLLEIHTLTKLSIERCFKVNNYEIIGKMEQLIALSIEGDTIAPRNLILPSLKPFSKLNNLKHLDLRTTSIRDKSFLEILKLENLVRLDAMWRMKKEIRNKIKENHKTLQSGFFMAYDFEKHKFYDGVEWWID